MRPTLVLLLPLAIACKGDDGSSGKDATNTLDPTTSETTEPTEPTTPCTAFIDTLDPAPGSEGVPVDASVTLTFDSAIEAGHPWSLEIDGVAGSATLAGDGTSATFTPDAPLETLTEYTVNATVCDDSNSATFTTVAGPLDPVDLEGNTYVLLFDDLAVTQPSNPGLLLGFVPVDYVLVQVGTVDLTAETLQTYGATAYDDYGSMLIDCAAALDAGVADFSGNPAFTMGPTMLQFQTSGDPIIVHDFELSGSFDATGDNIQNVDVYGLIDLTQPLYGFDCASVSLLTGGTCVPCPGGTTNDCLVLEGTAPQAALDASVDLATTCGL